MPYENVQRGAAADGRGIVLWVPTIANPAAPTVAELNAGTVKRITYGLTPDGFDWQTSIATITTGRYTLAQALELDGIVTDTLEVKWVYNRTTPTANEVLFGAPGLSGNIVVILGYTNDTVITASTKINGILPVTTSIPREVPPTANSELAKIQKLNVVGKVYREHEIVVAA